MQKAAAPHERSTHFLRLVPRKDTLEPAQIVPAAHKRSLPRLPGLQVVLKHSVALAAAVIALIAGVALFGLGGLHYYATPLPARGVERAHRLLRPSGRAGLAFGIAGGVIMLMTLLYAIRKKIPSLAKRGNSKHWLEAHIFCGLVGPALITLHTSFKFNGLVSVAYWSMVLVVLSGFVGRYLYVRIPRSIRGTELSLEEIRGRIDELQIRADMASGVADRSTTLDGEIAALLSERALLVRRAETLAQTKKLFDLWHVFHRPLVWVMFGIAALHVAIAVYMGYSVHL